jgi:hypothetical protein
VRAKSDHAKESGFMTKTRKLIPAAAVHFMAAAMALLSAASSVHAQSEYPTFYGTASVYVSFYPVDPPGPTSSFSASDVPATLTFYSTGYGSSSFWMDIMPSIDVPGMNFPFQEMMSGTLPGSAYTFAGGELGFSAYYDDTGTSITANMSIADPYNGGDYQVAFQGSTIPEPSSIVTLATGLAGMVVAGIYRRRLRRKPAA